MTLTIAKLSILTIGIRKSTVSMLSVAYFMITLNVIMQTVVLFSVVAPEESGQF